MEAALVQGGALKNDRQSRPHRLAADAVAAYQRGCGTNDEHAIAELICDLGHLAEEGASIFSRRSGEALGTGMRSIILMIATTLARTPRSRLRSRRGSLAALY